MQNCQTSLALSEFGRRACYFGGGVIYGSYLVYSIYKNGKENADFDHHLDVCVWVGGGVHCPIAPVCWRVDAENDNEGGSKLNVLVCLPNQCACMLES